jgi:hypothetical protein
MITSIVVAMDNVIVVAMMSIVVQKGGLVVNVKNGIVTIVDVATILARNVVLKKKMKNKIFENRLKKMSLFKCIYND